jgi:hypothetical protein
VAEIDECSIYLFFIPDLKTAPFGIHGDMRSEGTLTPSLSNAKSPDGGSGLEVSGIGTLVGGGT